MKNIFDKKGSIGSVGLVVLVIVLSVVILGGVVGAAWYYTKLQNSNNKSQTNFNNPNSNTASVIPTEAEESLTDETGADTITPDPTADWKTYSGEYYPSKYNFKYPENYRVSSSSQDIALIARLDDDILSKIFEISFSACSAPNNFQLVENNITINHYNYNDYLKLPNNNGCLSIDIKEGLATEDKANFGQILSTFKFTE